MRSHTRATVSAAADGKRSPLAQGLRAAASGRSDAGPVRRRALALDATGAAQAQGLAAVLRHHNVGGPDRHDRTRATGPNAGTGTLCAGRAAVRHELGRGVGHVDRTGGHVPRRAPPAGWRTASVAIFSRMGMGRNGTVTQSEYVSAHPRARFQPCLLRGTRPHALLLGLAPPRLYCMHGCASRLAATPQLRQHRAMEPVRRMALHSKLH